MDTVDKGSGQNQEGKEDRQLSKATSRVTKMDNSTILCWDQLNFFSLSYNALTTGTDSRKLLQLSSQIPKLLNILILVACKLRDIGMKICTSYDDLRRTDQIFDISSSYFSVE